jgi:hypothetical protein
MVPFEHPDVVPDGASFTADLEAATPQLLVDGR